ncbi:MAG: hypothetical protein ABEI78_02285 [Candidatus Nanohaloarchaea archaeon]
MVMMISTLNKVIFLLIVISIFFQFSASYQRSFSSQNYFDVPEFDSQKDILYKFALPFVFIYSMLYFLISKTLELVLDDSGAFSSGPDVNQESILITLSITLMLLASPFWEKLIRTMMLFGKYAVLLIGLFILYTVYQAAT